MPNLISIIIPTHNEEKNIPLVFLAVKKAMEMEVNYDYEIIFVDDGSDDESVHEIKKIAEANNNVYYLEFSRNFGKEAATSAGLHYARGGSVIIMDADLQHPPSLIPEFIRKWENGAEIVVGVRKRNKGASWFNKSCSLIYYRLINAMSETTITPHATDYRLLDCKVVKELNRLTERNRMTRALIDWLGFKREYMYFVADERANGEASYGFFELLKLAMNSMVSMSLLPLKLAGYCGIFIILTSGPLGIFIFVEKYIMHDPWGLSISGSAILAVIILFLVGIILACLGLMALYIASIHSEVINRPLYVLRKSKVKSP
ncbi:glycosyltransferase family 2 protein [Candidatus Parcubacteria bacterium]|nr:glycosyltransferase family 2 protein [Candidatus Parcubacteria bacterium]